jgi:hypothetical protein
MGVSAGFLALGDSAIGYGAAAAPGALGTVATIAAASLNGASGGVYDVEVHAVYSGTIADPAERDNMQLLHGAVVVGRCLAHPVANTAAIPSRFARVTVAVGEGLTVQSVGAATASSVYRARIHATRVQ